MKTKTTKTSAVEQPVPKAKLLQLTAELRALRDRIRRSAQKLPGPTSEERAGDAPLSLEAFVEDEMMSLADEVASVALSLEELAKAPHRPLAARRARIAEATSLGYPSHLRFGYGGENDPFWFVRGIPHSEARSFVLPDRKDSPIHRLSLSFLLR